MTINPPVKIVTGTNVSFVDMKQIEPGYKFVGAAEQRTYAGGGSKFISGDTLMARITPCLENGKIGQYKSDDDLPANGSTEFIVFRGKPHFTDNEYVYYLITSPDIRNFSIGQMTGTSGRQRVPTDCFSKYPVILPPLAEQRAIAAILKMLDNKIELNRRMNATLEAMARALFKSWFVDFDPVRAKMAGRKPFDMDAATAALFPNRFASSPLGDIPKGWIVSMLSEVTAELRRGISPRYTNSGGIRVLNQKCIRNQIVSFEDARSHDHIAKPITGRELEPGDILINSTGVGTLGRVAQIWHLDEPTITDSHVTVVRPNPAITPPIYLGLNLMERQTEIEGLGEGSTGQTD